ncbi:umecyanin-like [Salvia miltiorrhiza]|uniref:umecyanin-like n=1 Tax=Salvia miltiorrhiza TaxID=226208 RepID=UPI0025AC8976|nr:umecyanin-like [Salvia miltiorrhiza]XP_057785533.1 umecyanin-like [Salvia miltiorrhiza]
MANTKNLVLFGWLAAAALLSGCAADTYTVGDDLGWTRPPLGEVAYQTWARLKDFDVGDTITFSWTGTHNVAQVTKDGYDNCSATSNLGPVQTVSPYNFILNSTEPYYFICTVGDHCSNGQKVTVQVRSFNAASPSLTTAAFSAIFLAVSASVALLI